LFAVLVMPLILFLLILATDLANFYTVREEIRTILDDQARLVLTRPRSDSSETAAVESRLNKLGLFVEDVKVNIKRSDGAVELVCDATYRGLLTPLVGGLLGRSLPVLSVGHTVAARQPRTRLLIVLDRTVRSLTADLCADPELEADKRFVSKLIATLSAAGVLGISVGFSPPDASYGGPEITMIDPGAPVRGCGGKEVSVPGDVVHLPGVRSTAPRAEDFARAVRQELQRAGSSPSASVGVSERLGVVAVVRGALGTGTDLLPILGAELERAARDAGVQVRLAFFAAPGGVGEVLLRTRAGYGGVVTRALAVRAEELEKTALLQATVGHLGRSVFIAR
jgi:hypothetical protein